MPAYAIKVKTVIEIDNVLDTISALQGNLTGTVSTAEKGVYTFENEALEELVMSSSSAPLLPGCYAIFKFKRYEDSSLSYTGLNKHENEDVGGWDTVVKRKEYELLFYNQQSTMNAPEIDEVDVSEADEEPEPPKAPVPTRTPPAKPDFVTAAFGVKSPIAPAKPQQPEKPKVDVSGVAVGSAVAHAKFGIGKVIELNRGYVTVCFEQGEKRFLFSNAFESGFLKVQ